MRRPTFALIAGPVLVATGVLALVGCGSNGEESAPTTSTTESLESWAGDLCSAADRYVRSVRSAGQTLTAGDVTVKTLKSAAGDVESATTTLLSDLQDLGSPATSAGAEARKAIDGLRSELNRDVAAVKGAIEDVSDVTAVLNAVSVVTGTLAKAKTQVTDTITEIDQFDAKGELHQAFDDAASCASFTKP